MCQGQGQQPLSLEEVKALAARGLPWATQAVEQLGRLQRTAGDNAEKLRRTTWAWLHRVALQQGRERYVDPATGMGVFTTAALKRQDCCGYSCRHCPHGAGPGGLLSKEEKLATLAVVADW
eukprot:s817_g5.t1